MGSNWQALEKVDELLNFRINFSEVRLAKEIGRGAFAEVYEGRYCGQKVAVKRPFDQSSSHSKEEFAKEVKFMCSLHSPYVVPVIGYCLDEKNLSLVLDFYSRGSLSFVLWNKEEKLNWHTKWLICRDAALALNYLHSRRPSLLHRDVKSGNFLMGWDGRVRLTDFGTMVTDELKTQENGSGEEGKEDIVGTVVYASPEAWRGERYTKKSEVYSYGLLICEIATRKEPWFELNKETEREELKNRVLKGIRPELPEDIPEHFSSLIHKCWESDPDNRPTFEEILKEFDEEGAFLKGEVIEDEIDALKEEIEVLTTELKVQKQLRTSSLNESSELEAQIKNLSCKNAELESQLSELRIKITVEEQLKETQEKTRKAADEEKQAKLVALEAAFRELDANFKKEKRKTEKLQKDLEKAEKEKEEASLLKPNDSQRRDSEVSPMRELKPTDSISAEDFDEQLKKSLEAKREERRRKQKEDEEREAAEKAEKQRQREERKQQRNSRRTGLGLSSDMTNSLSSSSISAFSSLSTSTADLSIPPTPTREASSSSLKASEEVTPTESKPPESLTQEEFEQQLRKNLDAKREERRLKQKEEEEKAEKEREEKQRERDERKQRNSRKIIGGLSVGNDASHNSSSAPPSATPTENHPPHPLSSSSASSINISVPLIQTSLVVTSPPSPPPSPLPTEDVASAETSSGLDCSLYLSAVGGNEETKTTPQEDDNLSKNSPIDQQQQVDQTKEAVKVLNDIKDKPEEAHPAHTSASVQQQQQQAPPSEPLSSPQSSSPSSTTSTPSPSSTTATAESSSHPAPAECPPTVPQPEIQTTSAVSQIDHSPSRGQPEPSTITTTTPEPSPEPITTPAPVAPNTAPSSDQEAPRDPNPASDQLTAKEEEVSNNTTALDESTTPYFDAETTPRSVNKEETTSSPPSTSSDPPITANQVANGISLETAVDPHFVPISSDEKQVDCKPPTSNPTPQDRHPEPIGSLTPVNQMLESIEQSDKVTSSASPTKGEFSFSLPQPSTPPPSSLSSSSEAAATVTPTTMSSPRGFTTEQKGVNRTPPDVSTTDAADPSDQSFRDRATSFRELSDRWKKMVNAVVASTPSPPPPSPTSAPANYRKSINLTPRAKGAGSQNKINSPNSPSSASTSPLSSPRTTGAAAAAGAGAGAQAGASPGISLSSFTASWMARCSTRTRSQSTSSNPPGPSLGRTRPVSAISPSPSPIHSFPITIPLLPGSPSPSPSPPPPSPSSPRSILTDSAVGVPTLASPKSSPTTMRRNTVDNLRPKFTKKGKNEIIMNNNTNSTNNNAAPIASSPPTNPALHSLISKFDK